MIGLFDSGVGGLSIAAEIRSRLPDADLLYIADRARAPWGVRSDTEILNMSIELADRLVAEGSSLVVVACHTGSVVALEALRKRHPGLPFVGLDPAIKPAAAMNNGTVAVLATHTTLRSRSYQTLIADHAVDTEVVGVACPRWVELVEDGITDGPDAEDAVAEVIDPLLDRGIGAYVLACTHFPFLQDLIRERITPGGVLVSPTDGVARQVDRLIEDRSGSGRTRIISTGREDGVVERVAGLGGLDLRGQDLTFG